MIEDLVTEKILPSSKYRGGYHTRIYASVTDPSLLFKEIKGLWYPNSGVVEGYTQDLFNHEVGGDVNALLEPRYNLGEFIPRTRLVWRGSPSGGDKGFIVMEEVLGDEIYNSYGINEEQAVKLDQLLARAVVMGINTLDLDLKLRRMPDIINKGGLINIMIGKIEPSQSSQPYIIDTYPAKTGSDYSHETWRDALRWLSLQSARYPYSQARKALADFFNSPQLIS